MSRIGGSTLLQTSITLGQRVWKRQPGGGRIAEGTSPVMICCGRARLDLGVGDRDRRQQRLGVGVQRAGVELDARGDLDDAAEIHHGDAVADVAHHGKIVGDEDVGQPQPLLQLLKQVHDLRLDRHVERRHRLVADDQRRLERQRAGDADPLALAAGEFVRVAVGHVGQQAHHVEQAGDALAVDRAVACHAVHLERLADDLRPPSCAGSASRTGPGRPSACAGGSAACGRGRSRRYPRPRRRPGPR